MFLYRHPRTLLTSEQLAGFVGYDMKQLAKALDAFIAAGLLKRTAQPTAHAARMYLLVLDGPHGGGLRTVLELASSRQGRRQILDAMNSGSAQESRSTESLQQTKIIELRHAQSA